VSYPARQAYGESPINLCFLRSIKRRAERERETKGTWTGSPPSRRRPPPRRAMAPAMLLYIVVVDEGASSFRYTRSLLHSTLQLMGCKPRHAFEVCSPPFHSSGSAIGCAFLQRSGLIRFDSHFRSRISLADQPQGLRCRPG
jgi:hypothetical protein